MGLILYYARMALYSIRQTPGLSILMVLALSCGIGLGMVGITLQHIFSQHPAPRLEGMVYRVTLDAGNPERIPTDPKDHPKLLTWIDTRTLIEKGTRWRQTPSVNYTAWVRDTQSIERPERLEIRAGSADFFPMFKAPLQYGRFWTRDEDRQSAHVVVISKDANEQLYGGEDSVGRLLEIESRLFEIVGVLDEWHVRRPYDVSQGPLPVEELFAPITTMVSFDLRREGSTHCWGDSQPGYEGFLNSECTWLGFWAELKSEEARQEYLSFLDAHARNQQELGRFGRPIDNRIYSIREWMEFIDVIPAPVTIILVLSMLFLVVCVINSIGLLRAKLSARKHEIAIRRALGATRYNVLIQYLVESMMVGLVGGIFGLLITSGGMAGIRLMLKPIGEEQFDYLFRLDEWSIAMAFIVAFLSAVSAGLYPIWRVCRLQPLIPLKGG